MIDTDKYEGHLIDKAVENYSQVWCWSKWMLKNAETIEQHEATSTLLEDAPLLLAEVEKLQAWKKLVSDIVQQHDGSHLRKMLKELTK
tara:strand:+ start:194 stop:457 length:264 start_codon:yes stop_codon:yes gene_type:complete